MNEEDSARPWKMATIVLGVICAALTGVVVMQSAQTLHPASAAGKVSPPGDAPVSLREFKGPDGLLVAAKTAMKAKFDGAGKLTYKSAGVHEITVDTTIVDSTGPTNDGQTNIAISVKLLVTKQPGNALLAAISATGAVPVPLDTPKETVDATKEAALSAAADSTFADLLSTLKNGSDE